MSEFIINDERVYYKRNYKEINDKKMEITSAEFVISNTDVKKCPAGIFPEYAFIGRSNVGKSSLINMLTARKGLAMTSATPGKTMLINHFLINKNWYSIIFTKADKLKGGRLKMNVNAYLRELSKQWEELPPYFISSSENRTGRTEILNYIENINKEINYK